MGVTIELKDNSGICKLKHQQLFLGTGRINVRDAWFAANILYLAHLFEPSVQSFGGIADNASPNMQRSSSFV